MNITKNTHYQNEHGKQFKDYMKEKNPELWEQACLWSSLKYHVRAGKKEGESKEKDLKKRDDYINEVIELEGSWGFEVYTRELDDIKKDFENWKGE